jgi:hypothetical protein
MHDIDSVFIATNLEEGEDVSPDNSLDRYELVEALVRVAYVKFVKTSICKSPADAIQKLMTENIVPHADRINAVRVRKEFYTVEVEVAIQPFMLNTRTVFNKFASVGRGGDRFMKWPDFFKLLDAASWIDNDFTREEAKFSFVHSILTVEDETKTDRYTLQSYIGFLECIARICSLKTLGELILAPVLPL